MIVEKQKPINKSSKDIPHYMLTTKSTLNSEINKKLNNLFKNESSRQKFRKKFYKVTNQLDNYYYPKIHNRSWYPNGLYKIKKRYNETAIGLEHIYEKNNVEELETIEDKKKSDNKKDDNLNYFENFITKNPLPMNSYYLTIEYCSNCDLHSEITIHNERIFKNLSKKYKKILNMHFPFLKVLLIPIDTDIIKEKKVIYPKINKNGEQYINTEKINEKYKKCKIGAFEIKYYDHDKNMVISSKLKEKNFPKINYTIEKIRNLLPKFKLILNLYDKEDYEDSSKLEGIQVNIYINNNSEKENEIINEINGIVKNYLNPKSRLEQIKQERYLKKINAYEGLNEDIIDHIYYTENPKNNKKSKINKNKSEKGTFLYRRFSLIKKNKEDENNNTSIIEFDPLVYDSYYIETVENENFLSSNLYLNFDNIFNENNNTIFLINKLIGLYHQTKSFLEFELFEIVDEGNKNEKIEKDNNINSKENKNIIKNAKIILKSIQNPKIKYFINESNEEGKYLSRIEPEIYYIKIICSGYLEISNKIECVKGLKKFSYKMIPIPDINININIIDTDNNPVKNAFVVVKKERVILFEGLGNKNGKITFLAKSDQNDFIICIEKFGYKNCARRFIRNDFLNLNKKDENQKNNIENIEMYFVMVNDKEIENNIIFVTYINCNKKILKLILNNKNNNNDNENSEKNENDENTDNKEENENKINIIKNDQFDKMGFLLLKFNKEKKEENKEENSNKDNLSINNKNSNEFNDNNDYNNIIRIGFTINPFLLNYDKNKNEEKSNENNKNNNNENNNPELEELFPKLCISSIIYTSHNLIENTIPFLNNKILDNSQLYWDLGWLDIENQIYYQTSGIFTSIINDKILYFEKFITFLQYFIDNNNIAINLFESFNFQKSILTEDNRYLDEKIFEEQLNNYLENIDDGDEKKIFINFITSILIDSDVENDIENKISYIKLRRLINNNLYNFKFFSN